MMILPFTVLQLLDCFLFFSILVTPLALKNGSFISQFLERQYDFVVGVVLLLRIYAFSIDNQVLTPTFFKMSFCLFLPKL